VALGSRADGFQVPPETPHAGGKNGDKKTRVTSTYVVEKGSRWLLPPDPDQGLPTK
jgi:hypothetical protein